MKLEKKPSRRARRRGSLKAVERPGTDQSSGKAQNPEPKETQPEEENDSERSTDEPQSFFSRFRRWWVASTGFRDLAFYLLFMTVFSIVSFETKPGEVQFYLNRLHEGNIGRGFHQVTSRELLYEWLRTTFAEQAFPATGPDGKPLDSVGRLTISGQARVLGAMRLRQVRSRDRSCDIVGRLKEVPGGEGRVRCNRDYSSSHESVAPIVNRTSPEWDDLEDFTRPFEFQTVSELNTTILYIESGEFASYYQDGFALDIVPNLGPAAFAERVDSCRTVMDASIDLCLESQNLSRIDLESLITTPSPTPEPQPTTNALEPLILISGVRQSDGRSTPPVFFLEETVILNENNPIQTIDFELRNEGVLSIDWTAYFFDRDGMRIENLGTIGWLSQTMNSEGSLECENGNCEVSRLSLTVAAGQGGYLLDELRPGEIRRAVGSPLDIVFQGQGVWESKSATLHIDVFLQRLGDSRRRLGEGEREEPPRAPRRHLVQTGNETAGEPCEEMVDITQDVPLELNLSECRMVVDSADGCELDYVSFQQMHDLMEGCRGCKCQEPDGDCIQNCSPKDLFQKQVTALEENQWIDRQTRAVILDVSMLNANFNLFTTVRCVLEMPPSGNNRPYVRARTFKIYRYRSPYDYFIAICEILFVVLVGYFLVHLLLEIYGQRWSYFRSGWSYIDWACLGFSIAMISLRIAELYRLNSFSFDSTSIAYIDFPPLGYFSRMELNVSAINFFLIYFKAFKFLKLLPRMGLILSTISTAATDVLLLTVVIIILYIGFSAAFYICFGPDLYNYRTFVDSIGSLSRTVLGDFDYHALSDSNAPMARFLFYAFVLFISFIGLSMFLALVNDAYSQVKETEPSISQILADLKHNILKQWQHMKEMQKSFFGVKQVKKPRVTIRDMRPALKGNQRALKALETTGISEILEKYGIDGNGDHLTRQELVQILTELADKEADVLDLLREQEASKETRDEDGNMKDLTPEEAAQQRSRAKLELYDQRLESVSFRMKAMSKNIAKRVSTMTELLVMVSKEISQDIQSSIVPPTWAQ